MKQILIMSTILIFAIVLIRAVFGKRMSMRLRYALWLLVAIRLLVPFQIGHSSISAANVITPSSNAQPTVISYEIADAPTAVTLPVQDVSPLRVIWYVGMAAAALWVIFVNVRFYYRARQGAKRMQHHGFRVYVSEGVTSPCQIGFSIFLTKEVANDETSLRHVLAHEKTHFYHGDVLWSLLRVALVCVYWFFPPVWLAAILSKQDCELACDEGALRRLGDTERFAYGKTLVSLAAQASVQFFCAATTMAQSKKELIARINVIASKKKRPILLTVLTIALVGTAAVCTFTGRTKAVAKPPKPTEPPKQSYFQDVLIETTVAQPSMEKPAVARPIIKQEPIFTEEPTEVLTTEPTTYSEPQAEIPYEAQPAIPTENYEAPDRYNMLDNSIATNPNYATENGVNDPNANSNYAGPQPCVPGVTTPDNYGFPVINWEDPTTGPYIGFP